MRLKQLLYGCKMASLLVLSAFTFASCSDDEETTTPAYVGSWVEEESMNYAPLKVVAMSEYRDLLVLTTSTFEINEQVKYAGTTNWISYTGQKGSLSQNGNIITTKLLEESVTLYDDNYYYTGITYVKLPIEEQETSAVQWSVDGNVLTAVYDEDKDGKFDVVGGFDYEKTYTKL